MEFSEFLLFRLANASFLSGRMGMMILMDESMSFDAFQLLLVLMFDSRQSSVLRMSGATALRTASSLELPLDAP